MSNEAGHWVSCENPLIDHFHSQNYKHKVNLHKSPISNANYSKVDNN